MLIDICDELAYNPGSGKAYHVIADNVVGFKAGRHVIFYRRIDDNEIEIVRILHEQMDLKSRMSEK